MREELPGSTARVLVVDDEPLVLRAFDRALRELHDVVTIAEPVVARRFFESHPVDAAIIDLQMPDINGLALLRHLRAAQPNAEAIMMSGEGTVPAAVEAMQMGAYDFFCKPVVDMEEVVRRVGTALERQRMRQLNAASHRDGGGPGDEVTLIGDSRSMRELRAFVEQIARADTAVLIHGETGTGKELVARALHDHSARSGGPFVAVNCAGITGTLIESELFGHRRGAFTGAQTSHKGLFEAAHGGTLFLDEVGDMQMETQVRLLRALQEGEVRPVGSTKTYKVDVRVIAATNADVELLVRQGRFRADLFYRLSVVQIDVPPLREPREDIPSLARHLLQASGAPTHALSDDALSALMGHPWHGNVRELRNALDHARAVAAAAEIRREDLPAAVRAVRVRSRGLGHDAFDVSMELPYASQRTEVIRAFEARYVERLLGAASGNLSEASRRSGIDRSNLRRMMRRHSISLDSFRT